MSDNKRKKKEDEKRCGLSEGSHDTLCILPKCTTGKPDLPEICLDRRAVQFSAKADYLLAGNGPYVERFDLIDEEKKNEKKWKRRPRVGVFTVLNDGTKEYVIDQILFLSKSSHFFCVSSLGAIALVSGEAVLGGGGQIGKGLATVVRKNTKDFHVSLIPSTNQLLILNEKSLFICSWTLTKNILNVQEFVYLNEVMPFPRLFCNCRSPNPQSISLVMQTTAGELQLFSNSIPKFNWTSLCNANTQEEREKFLNKMCLQPVTLESNEKVSGMAWLNEGEDLVVGLTNKSIVLLNLPRSGVKTLGRFEMVTTSRSPFIHFAFAKKRRIIVAVSDERAILIRVSTDFRSMQYGGQIHVHSRILAISLNEPHLAFASRNGGLTSVEVDDYLDPYPCPTSKDLSISAFALMTGGEGAPFPHSVNSVLILTSDGATKWLSSPLYKKGECGFMYMKNSQLLSTMSDLDGPSSFTYLVSGSTCLGSTAVAYSSNKMRIVHLDARDALLLGQPRTKLYKMQTARIESVLVTAGMITVSIDGGRMVMAPCELVMSGHYTLGVKMIGWNENCGKVVGIHLTKETSLLLLTSKGILYFSTNTRTNFEDVGAQGNTVDLVVGRSNWAEAKEIANVFTSMKLDSDDYFVAMEPSTKGIAVITHKGKLQMVQVTKSGRFKILALLYNTNDHEDERVLCASMRINGSFRFIRKNNKNDLVFNPDSETAKKICIPMAGVSKSIDITYSPHSTRVYYIQNKVLWVSEIEQVWTSYRTAILSEAIASYKILFSRVINICDGVTILTVAEGGRFSWSTVDEKGTIQFHSESIIPNLDYTSMDVVEAPPKGKRCCKRTFVLLSARTGEILIGSASPIYPRGVRHYINDSYEEGRDGNVVFSSIMTMKDNMDPSLERNCVKEVVFASRTVEEDEEKDSHFLIGALCETNSGRSFVAIYNTNYPEPERFLTVNQLLSRLILEDDHSHISQISLVGSRSNGATLIGLIDNSQIVMWNNVHLEIYGRDDDPFMYSLPNSLSDLSWLKSSDSSTRSITSFHATTFPGAETMIAVLCGTDKGELVLECEDEGTRKDTKEVIHDVIHTGECIAVKDIRTSRSPFFKEELLPRTLIIFAVQGMTILVCRVMLPLEKKKKIQLLILHRIQTVFSSISLIGNVNIDDEDDNLSIPRMFVVSPLYTNDKSGLSVVQCCKRQYFIQWYKADKEWKDGGRKCLCRVCVRCPDQPERRSLEPPRLKKGRTPRQSEMPFGLSEMMAMLDMKTGKGRSRRFNEKDAALVMARANVDWYVAQDSLHKTNGVVTSAVEEAKKKKK